MPKSHAPIALCLRRMSRKTGISSNPLRLSTSLAAGGAAEKAAVIFRKCVCRRGRGVSVSSARTNVMRKSARPTPAHCTALLPRRHDVNQDNFLDRDEVGVVELIWAAHETNVSGMYATTTVCTCVFVSSLSGFCSVDGNCACDPRFHLLTLCVRCR